MHIIKGIKEFVKSDPLLFTTPGHNLGNGVFSGLKKLLGKDIFNYDLSELEGLDNLQNPDGIILKSMLRTSEIYGSKLTFYLVNGSSSGIVALMLSALKPKEKVLIARNAHKSLINALTLSGAVPVWLSTEWLDDWNIPGPVNPDSLKKKLDDNPDIKAVFVTSPTYQGVVSDIKNVSEICKRKKVFLFVDEAHGALWNFNDDLPVPAIQLGADASVQSLHKTASALTPGALLHISKNSKLDVNKIQQCLNIINTTSPSYPVMAGIEGAIEYLVSLKGKKKLLKLLENIDEFRISLRDMPEIELLSNSDFYNIDKTKILFSAEGIPGTSLSDYMYDEHNIEVELDNDASLLIYTGIGMQRKKLLKLQQAICDGLSVLPKQPRQNTITSLIEPKMALTPREAFYKPSKKMPLKKCLGLISKETIVPYPPGIPVLIAGEVIQEMHIEILGDRKNIEIILD